MNKRLIISLFSILCTISTMAQVDYFYPLQKELEYVGIDYLQDDTKAKSIGLPHAYTGKGVLLADIDMGFNYCNMAFIDPYTGQQRIKYIYYADWNKLYETPASIDSLASFNKNIDQSHGLHTTSIAAGNYPDSLKCLAGVAISSDIIFCQDRNDGNGEKYNSYTRQLQVIDSIATLLNVPCVVNLSKGTKSLSFFQDKNIHTEQFDKFTGQGKTPGRIVCVSSDNDGKRDGTPVIQHQFANDNDTVKFLSATLSKTGDPCGVFILCPDSNSVKIDVDVYDTEKQCIITDFVVCDLLGDSITSTSDIKSEIKHQDDMYGRPFVILSLQLSDNDEKLALSYKITGKKGTSITIKPDDLNSMLPDGYSAYNDSIPYGNIELMCLTPSVLSVGSIATKDCVDPVLPKQGVIHKGEVAHNSGWGVDYYGTIYPDVCAPGVCILVSEGDYKETYPYKVTDAKGNISGLDYHSGTSLATPIVAGVVALLLERDPTLTVERVRALLYQTNDVTEQCYNDNKMPIGGHGILNAPKLMKALIAEQTGITPVNMSRDDSNTTSYDIMGRVVDPKVYHGIIIKNGRKYIN